MKLSRTSILLLCTAVVTFTSIGMSTFSLFLPPIEKEFGLSRALATLPYMIAMIGWAAGAVLFGKLADDYGSRPVVLAGIVLMAAGFVGMGSSQNLWQISLSYGVLVGMAMGACGLVIMSLLVSKHFEARNRGLAVSVIQTAPPLSPLLFAPLIYLLIKSYDWRVAAIASGVLLAGVALPLAWLGARDPKTTLAARGRRMAWSACLPYLRNRSLMLLFAVRFSCGVAFFQIAHLVSLTISKGFDSATGATAVSVFGAAAGVSALLFGWLSRSLRPRAHAWSELFGARRRHVDACAQPIERTCFLCRRGISHRANLRHCRDRQRHVLRDRRPENGGSDSGLEFHRAPDRLGRRPDGRQHCLRPNG